MYFHSFPVELVGGPHDGVEFRWLGVPMLTEFISMGWKENKIFYQRDYWRNDGTWVYRLALHMNEEAVSNKHCVGR